MKDKKKGERKIGKDDFYDKVNYYESRNIFSSNEPYNKGMRLYTENSFTSHMWDKINTVGKYFPDEGDVNIIKNDFTKKVLESITNAQSMKSTKLGCKKCGYGKSILTNSRSLRLPML